jgi:hypothetical protein
MDFTFSSVEPLLMKQDFATSLKHKRKEFTFDDLIATLDVEEKARAKDTRGKVIAGSSSANFVHRGNPKF